MTNEEIVQAREYGTWLVWDDEWHSYESLVTVCTTIPGGSGTYVLCEGFQFWAKIDHLRKATPQDMLKL